MDVKWAKEGYDRLSAQAAFPITQNGHKTTYWVGTRIFTDQDRSKAQAECQIFETEPGTPGARPATQTRFQCDTAAGKLEGDFTFTLSVVSSVAEVSGIIRTEGPVSLDSGEFPGWGNVWFKKGDPVVGISGFTTFTSILQDSDHKHVIPGEALTEFRYRVLDDGKPTGYTASVLFKSDGYLSCTIGKDSPYTCDTTKQAISDKHWDGTFVIRKK